MTGMIENAALDTRVAWVRDLLDRITVDGREEQAVAIWRSATDDGVSQSDSVSSWPRRDGANLHLAVSHAWGATFPTRCPRGWSTTQNIRGPRRCSRARRTSSTRGRSASRGGVPTPIASDRLAGRRFPWNRLSGKRSTPIRACLRSGAFGHEAKVDSLDGYPDISGIRALNSCRAHSSLRPLVRLTTYQALEP